jgi:signal transduction histidine kinase
MRYTDSTREREESPTSRNHDGHTPKIAQNQPARDRVISTYEGATVSTQDKVAVEKELKVLEIEEINLDELDPEAYTADNIKVLKGLDGIRKRPGMYLQGGTGIDGFHQLLTEIIDNGIDEGLAGYADTVTVTIHKDESVTVTDNGRGFPVQRSK